MRSVRLVGLAVLFAVVGMGRPAPASTPASAPTAGRVEVVAAVSSGISGYVLDGFGGVSPYNTAGAASPPDITGSAAWPGWDIARGITTDAGATGGYVVDGWGGIHPFGIGTVAEPAAATGGPYWRGWDIARDVALLPDGTGGYVLDGFGGIHTFATGSNPLPPRATGGPYWAGWNIARGIALLPDGTGGYVLDGWGGLHPFAVGSNAIPPKLGTTTPWPGWDIARAITVLPDGTGGYLLDGWGGMHPFGLGGAPSPPAASAGYLPNVDWTRGLAPYNGTYSEPGLTVETVAGGLNVPWDLGFTPDGTLLYTERPGRIGAVIGGQARLLGAPGDIYAVGESGMMGLAIDPDFATNRLFYTCQSHTSGGAAVDIRVLRWHVDAAYTTATRSGVNPVVSGLPLSPLGRHSGCRLRFGVDGHLWIGTGDAAMGANPQNPASLGGKVLRVDEDTGAAAPGNPGGSRVWTSGHRNVQGLAMRPGTNQVFSVEHGPNRDDEVNLLRAGGNGGWDPVPGYNETVPMTDLAKFPAAMRAVWSSGPSTIATSGATFLEGSQWLSWSGSLVVAALKGERLVIMTFDSAGHLVDDRDVVIGADRLRTPVLGPDGNLYVTTANGGGTDRILRIIPS